MNSGQLAWLQSLAGSGDPTTGEGGVGVPNTDLSIMGMTPDGRLFTIQGDTGVGMGETGGPGPRPAAGGHNNIIFSNSGPAHDNPFQVQSFAPSDDGYTYMYGTQDGRVNDGMHVARVPTDQIENPAAYEYWNGSGFDSHQYPETSPAIMGPPSGYDGVGEPSVHFYDNEALVTFNENMGNVFSSSSSDGVNWSPPQLVTAQPGVYGVFQSPLSGGDSIDASVSLWKPYGTHLVQIQNSDTRGLGAY